MHRRVERNPLATSTISRVQYTCKCRGILRDGKFSLRPSSHDIYETILADHNHDHIAVLRAMATTTDVLLPHSTARLDRYIARYPRWNVTCRTFTTILQLAGRAPPTPRAEEDRAHPFDGAAGDRSAGADHSDHHRAEKGPHAQALHRRPPQRTPKTNRNRPRPRKLGGGEVGDVAKISVTLHRPATTTRSYTAKGRSLRSNADIQLRRQRLRSPTQI